MADEVPCGCGCECEKLDLQAVPGVYGGDYPPFSTTGDVFGAAASVDASSSLTLRVNGILPTPVTSVASWIVAYDMIEAMETQRTVSIQGVSKRVVRVGHQIPLRFDACAVAAAGADPPLLKDLLLTASVECSDRRNPWLDAVPGGGFAPTPMNFYKGNDNWPNANQSSAWLTDIYAKSPPDGVSGNNACLFEIYRDGVSIASFQSPTPGPSKPNGNVHPFPSSVVAQCSQEGSYLVVAKALDSQIDALNGVSLTVPRSATPLISYSSFVILNTKYAYAQILANDRFANEDPQGNSAAYRENPHKERFSFTGTAPGNDVAGNGPLFAGALPQQVARAVPPDGRRGARGAFVRPAPFGGEESLVYDAPLTKITIRFNRPVVGITASMFAVTGYVPPDGAASTLQLQSVSPADDAGYDYEVAIDGEDQEPNSMWIITFTPAGGVALNLPKFSRQEFANRQAFPLFGKPDVIYADKATGSKYVWEGGSTQYRQVQNASDPEAGGTVLAARFMWCIAKDKSIGRFWINTFPDGNPSNALQDRTIIPRSSASTTVTPTERPSGEMSLTVLNNVTDVISSSSYKKTALSDQGVTDFLPRLPASSTTPTNGRFSYFGIPTTIYPSAPAWLGDCASPSEVQRHASLIFREDDILGFTYSGILSAPNGFVQGLVGAPLQPNSKVPVYWYNFWNPPFQAIYIFAEPDTSEINIESITLSGSGMPQNYWYGTASVNNAPRLSQNDAVETTITSAKIVMTANRGRLTYRGLNTTTVTELVLTMHVWCSGTFRWRRPQFFNFWGDMVSDFGDWSESRPFTSVVGVRDIIVPHDKEASGEFFEGLTIEDGE